MPESGNGDSPGRPLGEFELARLTLRLQVLAALLEAGRPIGAEALAHRLSWEGLAVSLQEVDRTAHQIFTRLPDGSIATVPAHPGYFEAVSVLNLAHRDYVPRPGIACFGPGPALEAQPIGREELDRVYSVVRPFCLPNSFGRLRRELILYTESRGGEASLQELCQDLRRYSRHATERWRSIPLEEEAVLSLRVRRDGSLMWDPEQQVARVVPLDPATRETRRRFREWACRILARAHFEQAVAGPGPVPRTVVLRSLKWRESYAVLLDCASGQVSTCAGLSSVRLRAALAGYEVVVGVDPEKEFKRLGIVSRAKTVRLRHGRELRDLQVRLRCTLGHRPGLSSPSKLRKLAEKDPQALLRILQVEAATLNDYFRFGVLHGFVLDRYHWCEILRVRVPWNQGEPLLPDLLARLAAEQATAHFTIRTTGRQGGSFRAVTASLQDDSAVLLLPDERRVTVDLDQILDCRLQPHSGSLAQNLIESLSGPV